MSVFGFCVCARCAKRSFSKRARGPEDDRLALHACSVHVRDVSKKIPLQQIDVLPGVGLLGLVKWHWSLIANPNLDCPVW